MQGIVATVILVLAVFCLSKARSVIASNRPKSVLRMCSIPLDWREKGGVSRMELANRSGIRIYLRDLAVEEVMDCLDQHPHLIRQWEIDIGDRRGSGGWSYGESAGGYVLGEVGDGMVFTKAVSFKDRSEVCAVFVLLSTAAYLNAEIPAADLALKRTPLRGAP
jgi:hypothetical protein